MNRDDIIKLAREAGFRDTTTPVVALGVSWEQVQRFAALIAAAEREACAKAVEDYCGAWDDEGYALATAIRAGGNGDHQIKGDGV